MDVRRSARRRTTLLVSILLLACVLRLWGIGDRLPDPSIGISPLDDSVVEETDRTTMFRAWAMWEGGVRTLTLDPGTVGWPSLSFYLTLFVQFLYRAAWSVGNPGSDARAFAAHFAQHPELLFIVGRLVGATIGVLSIYLLHRIGTRLVGRPAADIAALFLAVNPLHVQVSQRVSDPNLLALLFILLAVPPLLRARSDPSARAVLFAGTFIGLAAGSKYVPIILIGPLLVQVVAGYRDGVYSGRSLALRALAAVLVPIIVLASSSPYLLLRGARALDEIQAQHSALTSPWVGQAQTVPALPVYLAEVVPEVLTWPNYVLAILGFVLLVRRGGQFRMLALVPALIIVATGLLRSAQERYILAAVPFLILCASYVLVAGAARVGPGRAAAVLAAAVVALAVLPLWALAEYRDELSRADSRRVSRRWITANVPPTAPLGFDLYGPVLNSRGVERLAVTWPFHSSRAAGVRAAYSHVYLEGLQLYVVSGEVRGRFARSRSEFVKEAEFYDWLARTGYEAWSSRGQRLSGPDVTVLALPASISTRAERDSAWASTQFVGCDSVRLARWCGDLAAIGQALGRLDLTVEWASRGTALAKGTARLALLGLAGEAHLAMGQTAEALRVISVAADEYPTSIEIRLLMAMAYDRAGLQREARSAFAAALELAPDASTRAALRREFGRFDATVKQSE